MVHFRGSSSSPSLAFRRPDLSKVQKQFVYSLCKVKTAKTGSHIQRLTTNYEGVQAAFGGHSYQFVRGLPFLGLLSGAQIPIGLPPPPRPRCHQTSSSRWALRCLCLNCPGKNRRAAGGQLALKGPRRMLVRTTVSGSLACHVSVQQMSIWACPAFVTKCSRPVNSGPLKTDCLFVSIQTRGFPPLSKAIPRPLPALSS